jgi:hypothetical protein
MTQWRNSIQINGETRNKEWGNPERINFVTCIQVFNSSIYFLNVRTSCWCNLTNIFNLSLVHLIHWNISLNDN